MKKIILLIILLIGTENLLAQKLAVDKVENDGRRILISQDYTFYRDVITGDYADFNLSCTAVDGKKSFYIYFNICDKYKSVRIDKGKKLLIKLENDSILELSNNLSFSKNSSYSLSEEQIEKIVNGKVVKIRIDRNVDMIDKEIKKNKFSKRVKEAYNAIIVALQTKKDIYTDF